MKTLVITGMAKERAGRLAREVGGDGVHTLTTSDYEGVIALVTGQADYFLGICQSGAGGALALAIGMLGSEKCVVVSTPGKPPGPDTIETALQEGRIAFGTAIDHVELVVPRIVRAILAQEP